MDERVEQGPAALAPGRWRRRGAVSEDSAHWRHPAVVILAAAATSGTLLVVVIVGHAWIAAHVTASAFAFVMIVGLILVCAMRVMHHGEKLAEMLGEPMGALVLTGLALLVGGIRTRRA